MESYFLLQCRLIPPDFWGVIAASNNFTIRQHVKVLPKNCCSCPPCVDQENTFSVYAGISEATQTEILRVDEISDDWNRCCCKPFHPVRLEVRQYVPIPGVDPHVSDLNFLQQDVQQDFQNFSVFGRNQRSMMMKNMYMQRPVVLSMLRHDGTRCCYKCPCKQLDTFVCCSFCQDGMSVYAGPLYDDPNGERGRPHNIEAVKSRLIGTAKQPCLGGVCWPTLDVYEKASHDKFATVTGPFFFGGWCELCCSFSFDAVGKENADMARLIKMKPTSLLGSAVQLFTNADVYTVAMNPDAKLSPERKLTFLTGTILADYMFFDGNTVSLLNIIHSFQKKPSFYMLLKIVVCIL